MKFDEIKNSSQRVFKDISTEDLRVYIYPGMVGTFEEGGFTDMVNIVRREVQNPIGLSVSKSGHYVIDKRGVTHFFPFGFVELYWVPRDYADHVVC